MAKTTYETPALKTLMDAADAEGRIALRTPGVRKTREIETLPYYPALLDYRHHVDHCAECGGALVGCDEGEVLVLITRQLQEEQSLELAPQN